MARYERSKVPRSAPNFVAQTLVFLAFVRKKRFPYEGADSSANNRGNPEEPKLANGTCIDRYQQKGAMWARFIVAVRRRWVSEEGFAKMGLT